MALVGIMGEAFFGLQCDRAGLLVIVPNESAPRSLVAEVFDRGD
jgi:hypothetical protein